MSPPKWVYLLIIVTFNVVFSFYYSAQIVKPNQLSISMNQQRVNLLSLSFLLCFLLIFIRLGLWQLAWGQNFQELVLRQSYQFKHTQPQPGLIFDYDNFPLVQNQQSYSLSIYKPDLRLPLDQVFEQLDKVAPNFSSKFQTHIEKFKQNSKIKWQTFDANLTLDQKNQLNLPGLGFNSKISRVYPEGGQSEYLSTLERYYQKELRGRSGFSLESKNALGEATLTKKNWFTPPKDGVNLHTTIHREIQYIAKNALLSGISQYSAQAGSIIILRPQDGALLAMSNLTPSEASNSTQLTPNISALFEPGSIFKPLVIAMALDSQTINPNYTCSQCFKPRTIGEYTVTNWDNQLHPNSTLKDIIKNSDNIGMSFVISNLGLKNFLSYTHSLRLDGQTGIDMAGESKSPTKSYWADIDLAAASFGQGFATTQI